ncbi:tetratricopeptide repeat protein, partial [Streptomyces spectabilis]|uniref:ATP-binding protein n=1 Tax=Streptomyces spectabilis TaxID=68270 RepID=UPI0033ED1876
LQAHLVHALAGAGRRAEALATYQAVRRRLADELDVPPGRELTEARQRLLDRSTTTARPPVDPPRPDAEEAPRARPGRQAVPSTRPAQLPADLPVFAGRDADLAQVDALVPRRDSARSTSPAMAVITIEGMAGVGKTSLAVHWAHRVARHFPDGQLYADLRGYDPLSAAVDPQDTLRAFLFALGVHPQDMPVGADAQSSLYRSLLSGRRVLVLLDNTRDSAQVRPLLPGTPGCLVLVTSRTRLQGLVATVGARSCALRPLNDVEAREMLARRLGAPRVADEAAAVKAVIALCGRLPLALAIVAARAASGSPLASIAAELREGHGSLDALSGDETDARAVFSWSYRALSPEAARLFRLLALHPGPDVSRHAAASLAGLGLRETRTTLASLARSHLLTEPVPGRYTCHDLLRAYAGERLRTEETEAGRHGALGRLLDHALGTVRMAVDLLLPHRTARETPPPPRPGTATEPLSGREAAATWLSTEIPGLIALVESAAQGGFPVHAWQLALAVELPLDRRGRREEQIAVQRTALAAAEQHGDPLGLPHIHRTLGFALHRVGANEEALSHLNRALALFTALDHRDGQARTLRSLAFLANSRARHQDALDHYDRALALHRAAGHARGEATVLNEIGWTHILRGKHHEALAQCAASVALHQATGDANGEAAAWDSLGYAHHHLDQYTHALTCYRHALAIYREVGDHTLEAETLSHIGDTQHALGNRPSALDSWERAAAILSELGHPDTWQLLDKLHGTAADPP